MAACSKEWNCGRSHVEIAGPNPTRSVDVFLLGMLSFDRGHCDRPILLAEGPTECVVSKCVWSRMLSNEAADTRTGLLGHSKKKRNWVLGRAV